MSKGILATLRRPPVLLVGLALGLLLLYWGRTLAGALLGLALFGTLALLRPDLALLFVPLTVPLYLMPASIPGLRAGGFDLPLHEAALLLTCAATALRWVWDGCVRAYRQEYIPHSHQASRGLVQLHKSSYVVPVGSRQSAGPSATADCQLPTAGQPDTNFHRAVLGGIYAFCSRCALRALVAIRQGLGNERAPVLRAYAPHLLFLLAGLLGVALAAQRGPALTEFRRLIAEPLLFYLLVKLLAADSSDERSPPSNPTSAGAAASFALRPATLIAALALAGALAGLLGLLQYAGIDLVPLLGRKLCFAPDGGPCANVVGAGALRRVQSVYGHPNNLGLFLGRAWPLAAALALAALRTTSQEPRTGLLTRYQGSWCLVLGSVLCLAGLAVSFSRGAWLGALVAAAVLALGVVRTKNREPRTSFTLRRYGSWFLVLGSLVALALTLRGDLRGGSTSVRLLLWREALGYLWLHPLGIGLDQFLVYHSPGSGRSLIDPALIGTSEQYAAHPHNLLLDIWLRMGPLGLLAFAWLLLRCCRTALRHANRPLALGILAATAAALTHGLVDNFYFVSDLAIVFWLLIALSEAPDRL